MPELPSPGTLVDGKYRVVRLIGEGGMGSVFEARHEHLGSRVALKFLHPDLAERPGLVARFLQEARVSAAIRSPYVTQVIDVDQTPDGMPYLVMELLEGESLEQRLARGAPMPLIESLEIAVQILGALEAAHAHGVVHRDLKPDNVWLSPTPAGAHVKLLDFGIAKLKVSNEFRQIETRPGSMMGTPAYMAPEQAISADQVDARADLYSFGVILYEMLSGARPVDSDEPAVILEKLVRGEIHPLASRNPSLPPGLCMLIDRLVAPDPDRRPASATLVRGELLPYLPNTGYGLGYVTGVGRPSSAVATTVPPSDQLSPPFVTSTHASVGRIKTDAMPMMPGYVAPQPTVLGTSSPPVYVPPKQKRSGVGAFLLFTFVAALAGAGVWAYMNQSIFDDSEPPPLPGPAPSALGTVPSLEEAPVPVPETTHRPRPPVTTTKPTAEPETVPTHTTPHGETQTPPFAPGHPTSLPQLPPFTLPSTLPFPFPIPSTLPPFFQNLPGFSAPAHSAPSAEPAPPPSGGKPSL